MNIYKIKMKGGVIKFALSVSGTPSFGDSLFDSREDAQSEYELITGRDKANKESRLKVDAEHEEIRLLKLESYNRRYPRLTEFLNTIKDNMKRGRLKKTLEIRLRYDGVIMSRAKHTILMIEDNWLIDEFENKPIFKKGDVFMTGITQAEIAFYGFNKQKI